jgi:acetolactate synthase-1/2/3 large subunit
VRADACGTLDARALRFLDAIRFAVPDDGVIVADMCIPGYWLAGFHTPAHPRKLQIPLGWGTLGYAFPAALGAALAGTGPVVAVAGDGGFLYAAGELATVAQERIPLTLVIVDDGGYGMLRYDQDVTGADRYGVDLLTPDFAALAGAFGIRAEVVDGLDDEFGAALAEHVLDDGPSVLVARTPEPLVPPPTTSPNWYRRRR